MIGGFDGFHLGHRERVERARRMAARRATGLVGVVVDNCRPWLMSPEDRCMAVIAAGAGSAHACRFDSARSRATPQMLAELLIKRLDPGFVVMGGNDSRKGGLQILDGLHRAFVASGVAVEMFQGPDSRDLDAPTTELLGGYVAAGLLDRYAANSTAPYSVVGVVERGDRRGRTIGFPTANIRPDSRQRLPPNGVYAGLVRIGGRAYTSAINIGLRPTFYSQATRPLLEAHLINYEGDLYDMRIRVQLRTRLRGERKFESVESLVEQLGQDVAAARSLSTGWT